MPSYCVRHAGWGYYAAEPRLSYCESRHSLSMTENVPNYFKRRIEESSQGNKEFPTHCSLIHSICIHNAVYGNSTKEFSKIVLFEFILFPLNIVFHSKSSE